MKAAPNRYIISIPMTEGIDVTPATNENALYAQLEDITTVNLATQFHQVSTQAGLKSTYF
jgi:hypothetical protein